MPRFQPQHGQSTSVSGAPSSSGGFLFPPSSHTDFLQQQQGQGQQFLHPSSTAGTLPVRRSLSPGPGHMRRASSGTRSSAGGVRGAEAWDYTGGLGGSGQGLSVNALGALGARRMSPYPSPNASPRVPYVDLVQDDLDLGGGGGAQGMGGYGHAHNLSMGSNGGMGMGPTLSGLGNMGMGGGLGVPLGSNVGISSGGGYVDIGEPPVSAGYEGEVSITGRNMYASQLSNNNLNDGGSSNGGHRREGSTTSNQDAPTGPIAKQNVTTGRTANASIRRRKQDANFACTVPGCNSTFTRGFNLKGHLRSHYEQKPYKCHWPGCDKGFARQHDCKRHEQLHSNYRPFICEGCGKNFARMDALNRHLRSEAGGECARVVGEGGGVGLGGGAGGGGDSNQGSEGRMSVEGDGGKMEEDERKPYVPQPRRRNTGGQGAMDDEPWTVSL